MLIETEYPHIEKLGNEPARLKRAPRVRVSQIIADYLTHGWSPEEMCRQHTYLALAMTHSAMAYYFDHQTEIDKELEEEFRQSEIDRRSTAPSQFLLRMRAEGRV